MTMKHLRMHLKGSRGVYLLDIARINPETKQFSFVIHQKELQQEFIILKAIVFPYINLVWLGGIITFLGILDQRVAQKKLLFQTMADSFSIAIVGAGNVATNLALSLFETGANSF